MTQFANFILATGDKNALNLGSNDRRYYVADKDMSDEEAKPLRTVVKDRVTENLPNIETLAHCHAIDQHPDESDRDFIKRIKEQLKPKGY